MSRSHLGIYWAFTFVILEAAQAVFFGSAFQDYDSFLVGGVVFGLTAAGTLLWSAARAPQQLRIAWNQKAILIGLNTSTVVVWVAYFYALQIIEPAVAFTLFSGLIPVAILVAAILGTQEASPLRNRVEGLGIALILIAVCYLAEITVTGQSGFVRGGQMVALAGLCLAGLSGVSFAAMMIFSQRLDGLGVAPIAQYGLRFPVYALLALGAAWIGIDAKGPIDPSAFAVVLVVGLLIIAFPVFALQKAISLMSTLALASISALGPVFVFGFQLLEGRVSYAPATVTGLAIYCVGAVMAAYGGSRSQQAKVGCS